MTLQTAQAITNEFIFLSCILSDSSIAYEDALSQFYPRIQNTKVASHIDVTSFT